VRAFRWRVVEGASSESGPSKLIGYSYVGVSPLMAPEKGPNRLNMKFSESGRKVVIHLVRSLPPKISKDKKTITITFPEHGPAHLKRSKG
jgi:hypothetical protein